VLRRRCLLDDLSRIGHTACAEAVPRGTQPCPFLCGQPGAVGLCCAQCVSPRVGGRVASGPGSRVRARSQAVLTSSATSESCAGKSSFSKQVQSRITGFIGYIKSGCGLRRRFIVWTQPAREHRTRRRSGTRSACSRGSTRPSRTQTIGAWPHLSPCSRGARFAPDAATPQV